MKIIIAKTVLWVKIVARKKDGISERNGKADAKSQRQLSVCFVFYCIFALWNNNRPLVLQSVGC